MEPIPYHRSAGRMFAMKVLIIMFALLLLAMVVVVVVTMQLLLRKGSGRGADRGDARKTE